jgi:predicted TPR repeat methyltransferase
VVSSDTLLSEAQAAYRGGRVGEADVLCRGALRDRPTNADALHLLGKLHLDRGDHAEAIRILIQSLAYSPRNHVAWYDLASAYRASNDLQEAVRSLERAISIQPQFLSAYGQLATLYYALDCADDAAELYKKWASRDPENAEVLHMVAATAGGKPPERCSSAFVRAHFDKLAGTFDKRLVDDLGYRGHAVAVAALASHRSARTGLGSVLDAGCGTGLCGPLLRPYCRKLSGVDLSEHMIEYARRRAVYDELVTEDLFTFMAARPSEFDAIVSSDVFIYVGSLEQPIQSAHHALKSGGLLIITFEALLGPGAEPYRLEFHGRYSHRNFYIRSILTKFGFEILSVVEERIRRELKEDVIGYLATAQKHA